VKLEDFSPEVRKAGELLLEAWKQRSPHEMESFAQSLDGNSSGAGPMQADSIARAERIAAVSGSLNPASLLSADEPVSVGSVVLDQLASSFDRAWKSDAWSWTLKTERRAAVLSSLSPTQLTDVLEQAKAAPTDDAGDVLRRLLSDESDCDASVPLNPRLLAYEWAATVNSSLQPVVDTLRLETIRRTALKAFDNLLQNGFVGRKTELKKLCSFVEKFESGSDIPVLPISGIGGSGKSTLLAHLLRPLLKTSFDDPVAPMIVSMDFDRRCLLAGGELELSFELSRQLSMFYPQLTVPLARLREEVSRQRAQRGELKKDGYDSEQESLSRHGNEFDYDAAPHMRGAKLNQRLLVIALDTFEEWQRGQGQHRARDSTAARVLHWLSTVQREWGLRLKVIISGRAPLARVGGYAVAAGPINLKALRHVESVALLESLGVPPDAARPIAAFAGGMPLALKLAARYYLKLPQKRRDSFVNETSSELSGISVELRQGVLYRRFLDHIADPLARQVAHPGLALRRVSPLLIRDVLAHPCGLDKIEDHAAQELFNLLADEVWLVEEQGSDLVHRPELRSIMLRAMRTDPLQAPRVREVHAAAVQWYSSRKNPTEQERAESLYHRLILTERPEEFDSAVAGINPSILKNVAQSAADLPDPIRVQLLDRVGGRITLADAALLPQERRLAWASQQADELVRSGEPQRALNLWKRFCKGYTPGPWFAAATFQAQRWEDDVTVARVEYGNEPLRYAYLMSSVQPPHVQIALREHLDQKLMARMRRIGSVSRDIALLEDCYFAAVLGSTSPIPPPSTDLVAKWIEGSQLDATRFLRLRVLLPQAVHARRGRVLRRLLASGFRPTSEFLEEILRRLDAQRLPGIATRSLWSDLAAALDNGLKSAQALGKWSDMFAECVGRDLEEAGPGQGDALLDGFSSDDPEWRIPIRTALADCSNSRDRTQQLAYSLQSALGRWTPVDLRSTSLESECTRNPRAAWKRAVEYVDRCGALPQFMEALVDTGDERLKLVRDAYLQWHELRTRFDTGRLSGVRQTVRVGGVLASP